MTVYCNDRNTALLVRAVLFSFMSVLASASFAQAPIVDTSQSRSGYGQSQSSSVDYGTATQLQQLQQEVMQLRGMVEDQQYQIQQLQQRQQELEGRSAGRYSSDSSSATSAEQIPAANESNAIDASSAPVDLAGDEDAYRDAYNLIKAQKFDAAISAFQEFLKAYPGSRYEPNAYYWLGELYLQTQNLDASRDAYTTLVEKYPSNSKTADASYKLAKVHFLKGEKTKSRDMLKSVVSSYPGTATAQAAQKFLKENF